jgi:hypothetical protein
MQPFAAAPHGRRRQTEGFSAPEPKPGDGSHTPPLVLYARYGHHIKFFVNTFLVHREIPVENTPPGLPDPKKFFNQKSGRVARPSGGDLSILQAPLTPPFPRLSPLRAVAGL